MASAIGGDRVEAATADAVSLPIGTGDVAPKGDPAPDYSDFRRANFSGMTSGDLMFLGSQALGQIGPGTPPALVPWHILDVMAFDPVVYLGEQAVAAPLRDASLYYVKHGDSSVVAETEGWLRPLLPILLPMITRAIPYGLAPIALDWEAEDLTVTVKREGKAPRRQRFPAHQHYATAHDLHPGGTSLRVAGDRLVSIEAEGQTFNSDRAFVPVWDQAFGGWQGNASRRRAYPDWFEKQHVRLWRGRYLERSVDPPRIGYAPKGKVDIGGTQYSATNLLRAAVMALKNGGVGILPNTRDEAGNFAWQVEAMKLPDVSSIWDKSLDRCDSNILIASLVPPTTAGITEGTFAGGRIPNDLHVELVEGAGSWVAEVLTRIVGVVHRVNRGTSSEAPRVIARELPRAKVQRLMELYKSAATIKRKVGEGQEVSLAELIDESILDELGVARRPTDEAARPVGEAPEVGGAPPARDLMSDREERRNNAATPEGEQATGAPNEGVKP